MHVALQCNPSHKKCLLYLRVSNRFPLYRVCLLTFFGIFHRLSAPPCRCTSGIQRDHEGPKEGWGLAHGPSKKLDIFFWRILATVEFWATCLNFFPKTYQCPVCTWTLFSSNKPEDCARVTRGHRSPVLQAWQMLGSPATQKYQAKNQQNVKLILPHYRF